MDSTRIPLQDSSITAWAVALAVAFSNWDSSLMSPKYKDSVYAMQFKVNINLSYKIINMKFETIPLLEGVGELSSND